MMFQIKQKLTQNKHIVPGLIALITLLSISHIRGQSFGEEAVWLPLVMMADSGTNSNPINDGIATYYDATGDGACLFGPSPNDLMVAAFDTQNFDGSGICGAYVHVVGPQGDVTVRIVDWCPDCESDHIDLSLQAFGEIAPIVKGRVDITWQIVSPDIPGPIAYHFKEGSNQWWTAVQVRNHRNPISKLEFHNGSQWIDVPRTEYNYFMQTNPGMGVGPYTFRVTDIYGNVLVDNDIPHVENGTVNGAAQFLAGP